MAGVVPPLTGETSKCLSVNLYPEIYCRRNREHKMCGIININIKKYYINCSVYVNVVITRNREKNIKISISVGN